MSVQKKGPSNEIGRSRGGPSSKIHAVVDTYGNPVFILLSEGQKHDSQYAIPLLDSVDITGSQVAADRGYDANKIIDYIYDRGGEPTIPSKKMRRFNVIATGIYTKNVGLKCRYRHFSPA